MDYQLNLNKLELQRLISLTCDQIGRHYYWSTKGDAQNYSYHMNVLSELEPLRDKLKRICNL